MHSNTLWLSFILFVPFVAGLLVLVLRQARPALLVALAMMASTVSLLMSLDVYQEFLQSGHSYTVVQENYPWIPSIGASYHLAVDGISAPLLLLTTFLSLVLIAYLSPRLGKSAGTHLFCLLSLESALIGVLISADTLLFYVFWEAMLIPMYFLIAFWGGERRSNAALKFIIMMMAGSLLMLAGVLWTYWLYFEKTHILSFDLWNWTQMTDGSIPWLSARMQSILFFFFFISFAIKVPLFPFHSWLPDAQAEGPVAFNVLMVEVGAYAFIRFGLLLFPGATVAWAPIIVALALMNILYGSIVAFAQTDLKRLLAYAGFAHAGFIMLGIYVLTNYGLAGGVLSIVNSGITSAALFIVADVLRRRRGSQAIDDFGGLASRMPLLFFLFMVSVLGAVGLPGLNGFTGEFLVLLGAVQSNMVSPLWGYASGAGLVLSAVVMLWMFQRVMYGAVPDELGSVRDLSRSEKAGLWPLVAIIVGIGIGSALVTRPMEPAVKFVLGRAGLEASEAVPARLFLTRPMDRMGNAKPIEHRIISPPFSKEK